MRQDMDVAKLLAAGLLEAGQPLQYRKTVRAWGSIYSYGKVRSLAKLVALWPPCMNGCA